MNDSNAIKLTIEKLNSKQTEEVLFAIDQIRYSGNIQLLAALIELFEKTTSNEISLAITGLLNDLKNQDSTQVIVSAIQKNKRKDIRKSLLTSCWQSGLDYSEHIGFFTDLFIESDFELGFEAFTIIENIEKTIDAELINSLVIKLKDGLDIVTEDKKALLIELIHIIDRLKS